MANNFIFADWVALETLRSLVNKAQVAQFFNTEYNKEFTKAWAVGDTVRVKYPQRFLIVDGLGYQEQPIDRRYTTVAINQVFGVHFGWDDMEAALKLERPNSAVKSEYIDKAAEQMRAELDARCGLWAALNTNNITGALGTTPTTAQIYASCNTRLKENSALDGERGLIMSPLMTESLITSTATLAQFNPQPDLSKAWREGSLGRLYNFDCYESVNALFSQTAGTIAGTNTTTGANQSGSSILITATAGDTYLVGDVFTLAAVNNVNPVSRRSVGRLKQFTVTAPLTCAGGGADSLSFEPAIEGPGSQYQNVDALPAALATMVMYPGTTSPNAKVGNQGLALTKNAYALVGVPLEKPTSQEMASSMRDPVTGLSMRFVKSWDQPTSSMRHRLETVVGFGNLYNDQCAVRIMSLA